MSVRQVTGRWRRRDLLMGCAASALSLTVFAAVCEVALRLTNPMDADGRMVRHHPVRYETLAPNFKGRFHQIPVRTNEFGHRVPTTREKRYTQEKPGGIFRILVYGDSITFGDEWPAEVSFVEQLQQRLDPGMTRIEVLNLGVPGYNLHQEANYVQETALTFDPDLVILEVTEVNDILERTREGPHPISRWQGLKTWLRRHLYAYSVAADIWYHGRDSEVGKALRRFGKKAESTEITKPPPPRRLAKYPKRIMEAATSHYHAQQALIAGQRPAWVDTRESLKTIDETLLARDVPLLVMMVPPSWDISCSTWGCDQVPLTYGDVTAVGQPFYALLEESLASITPHQVYLHEAFSPYLLRDLCDGRKGHYGPRKTAVIADYLAGYLGRSGLLAGGGRPSALKRLAER